MTWEETIISIRKKPEFKDLVEQAYFEENLDLNVKRFGKSDEFIETLNLLKQYQPDAKLILDIGCGNGISSINFALNNYQVTAVEPDSSDTVGAGAVKKLRKQYGLDNIQIHEALAEDINFESDFFDVVYIRQAMHHANDLEKFINEGVRVLKPNGLLLTVRDHVIYNEKDKEWFLESHPLHKYYGGENAFTSQEYRNAFVGAGASIVKELKFFDSIINYFPLTEDGVELMKKQNIQNIKKKLSKKLGLLGDNWLVYQTYKILFNYKPLDETMVPGRMYSYIAIKK